MKHDLENHWYQLNQLMFHLNFCAMKLQVQSIHFNADVKLINFIQRKQSYLPPTHSPPLSPHQSHQLNSI